MVMFSKTILFAFFLFFTTFTTLVTSAPPNIRRRDSLKHSTNRRRIIGRGLEVETYHPKSKFKTFGSAGLDAPRPSGKAKGDPLKFTTSSFLASQLGLASSNIFFRSGYTLGPTKFAYVKQSLNGIVFANAVANVAYRGNKVVAFGSSFLEAEDLPKSLGKPVPTVKVEDAIKTAEHALDGKYNDWPTGLEYLVKADGSIALTHVIQVKNDVKFTWHEAFVDALDGTLLSVTDFVAHATYTVLPIGKQDLTESQETVKDPEDLVASPMGWHSDGQSNSTDTSGNNVLVVQRNLTDGEVYATNASSNATGQLVFDYPYDPTKPANISSNIDAARTNAFYVMNKLHDLTYRYGFTETAFNFQENNGNKGGKGGDGIVVSVQDATGFNNANFATPPDGQSGVCRMYIWTRTQVTQDSSLDNDVPVHEFFHGVTNRMTGGGSGRCLDTLEAGGLGEGWSDSMADWIRATPENRDVVIGKFLTGKPGGLRAFPYSTDPKVNPLKYSSLRTLFEAHDIGQVWANMLHIMLVNLITAHGFSATAATNPEGKEGNVVFLHLLMDALALQPCNPSFIDARNAWIQADIDRYNGTNTCLIWQTFASRGLGLDAVDHTDGFAVPPECSITLPPQPSAPVSASSALPSSIVISTSLPSIPEATTLSESAPVTGTASASAIVLPSWELPNPYPTALPPFVTFSASAVLPSEL